MWSHSAERFYYTQGKQSATLVTEIFKIWFWNVWWGDFTRAKTRNTEQSSFWSPWASVKRGSSFQWGAVMPVSCCACLPTVIPWLSYSLSLDWVSRRWIKVSRKSILVRDWMLRSQAVGPKSLEILSAQQRITLTLDRTISCRQKRIYMWNHFMTHS